MRNFEIINRLYSSGIRTKFLDVFLRVPKARFYIRELERKINEEANSPYPRQEVAQAVADAEERVKQIEQVVKIKDPQKNLKNDFKKK
jgi:hypothetical protein